MDARKHDTLRILGSDLDSRCIDLCKKHAKKAGVMVEWKVRDLKDFTTDWDHGVILCNPPYGERLMEQNEVKKLYRLMRSVFDRYSDWEKHIISGMRDFEAVYGKKADKRRKLSNGGMACTAYRYFPDRRENGTDRAMKG